MFPPVFEVCAADTSVQNLISDGLIVRLYPFGYLTAEQKKKRPYAVWQIIYGSPENALGQLPDTDFYGVAMTVWGETDESVRETAEALRDAIEPVAHVTGWDGEGRDPDTELYWVSFTIDWIVYR